MTRTKPDFRIAKRDDALRCADEYDALAASGGTALEAPADLKMEARRLRSFARWVDRKIAEFPHNGGSGR